MFGLVLFVTGNFRIANVTISMNCVDNVGLNCYLLFYDSLISFRPRLFTISYTAT